MTFTPTQEQLDIEQAFLTGENLTIEAAAGSGKTSVIKMIAKHTKGKKCLYMAFNKAIAEEVKHKLPDNVLSKTTHSIAYQAVGKDYREKLSRPRGRYINVAMTPAEISRYFKIKPVQTVKDIEIAKIAKMTVTNFECSRHDSISKKNLPKGFIEEVMGRANKRDEYVDIDQRDVEDSALMYAEKLWSARKDRHSDVMITHDSYLKMFQLTKPDLGYDIIFGDEFQDVNPCTLDIILNQNSQIVAVGDNSQAIYQFRLSMNGMDYIEGKRLKLSRSFRFGQAIADVANKILEGHTNLVIEGNPEQESIVGEVDISKPYTIISRTNASLLARAIDLIDQGVKVSIDANYKDFMRKLRESVSLYKGDMKRVKHEDLIGFANWGELLDEAENDGELQRIAKLINSGQVYSVLEVLDGYDNPTDPRVTLVSGHRSKGLEMSQVILDNDFQEWSEDLAPMDRNLLYVAATRAMDTLELNIDLEMKLAGDRITKEFKEMVGKDVKSLEKDYKL